MHLCSAFVTTEMLIHKNMDLPEIFQWCLLIVTNKSINQKQKNVSQYSLDHIFVLNMQA